MSWLPAYRLIRLPGYMVLSHGADFILSFDRAGRLFHAYRRRRSFRIGLDGRAVEVSGGGPDTLPLAVSLPLEERDGLLAEVREILREIAEAREITFEVDGDLFLPAGEARPEIERMAQAAAPEAMERQWKDFRALYGAVPVLPPDVYGSLLVQVTTGCAHNRCMFCALYRDRPFRIRSPEEFAEHVRAVLRFQGDAVARWRAIFLGDANPLVAPQPRLLEMLAGLRKQLGEGPASDLAETLYAFSDAGPPARTPSEYRELRELGLRRVYLGMETGHEPLRKALGKPGDAASLAERVALLKEAGIGVGLIVISGLGGRKLASEHVSRTCESLSSYPLDGRDIVYVSPLRREPGTKYAPWEIGKGMEPLGEEEVWAQAREFLARLAPLRDVRGVKTAIYDIGRFVY